MQRTPVKSSMIVSVGYDEATHSMEVEFNDGSIYTYSDVPVTVHAELVSAESQGKFFWSHIRNKYDFIRG